MVPENDSTTAFSQAEPRQRGTLINHAQLVLAEKRTSLAQLRTGIAVVALPMAIISFLIAMSQRYQLENVLHMLIPLMVLCACLILLGFFLVARAVIHLMRQERLLSHLKKMDPELGRLL